MPKFTEDEVVDAAYEQYGKPVCLDDLKKAMKCDTLEEAVTVILLDSSYWDWDPREGNFL